MEELAIRIHQIQERNSTGLGASVPSIIATPEKPALMSPKTEELYYTVDFSRAGEGEKVNIAEIRKKIKEEI